MPLPQITIRGNLTRDPEVRFLPSGTAVANLRVAASDRKRNDAGDWIDGDKCYLDVAVWKAIGENTAESLREGDAVIITGRLRQKSYTKKDGTEVTTYEVEADDIAPSLARATARVERKSGRGATVARLQADDPWAAPDDDIPPF